MSGNPPDSIVVYGLTFSCSENGLSTEEGYRFDANVADYLPLLTPKLTKKGTVAVRQPKIPEQSLYYWQAQCLFRGYPFNGNIKALQKRIREMGDGEMKYGFATAEARIKKEYQVYKDNGGKDNKAKDNRGKDTKAQGKDINGKDNKGKDKWKTLSLEQKLFRDPERFFKEELPKGKNGVMVIKDAEEDIWKGIHRTAESLGLQTESIEAPHEDDGSIPDPDKWIVIGRSRSTVADKIRQIAREFSRSSQHSAELREEKKGKPKKKVVPQALGSGKKAGGAWDITGSWEIKCEDIESNWDTYGLSMKVYSSTSEEGKEIWCIFDFGIITGIMRFMGSQEASRDIPTGSKKRKRLGYDSEEEEEEEDEATEDDSEDEDEYKEENDDPAFLLPKSASPSPQTPTWNYRWRGEETGTGEIVLYSDQDVLSMTFEGTGGTKVKGVYRNPFVEGDISFTGKKISAGNANTGGSAFNEWNSRSEAAHERARVRRWGGGRIRGW